MLKRWLQNQSAGRPGARRPSRASVANDGANRTASGSSSTSPGRRHPRRKQRGVALIIAVISIAILTAVATEFLYSSRVDLQMAANHRDDVRAYYMARSGVGLARLVLSFQKQLDSIKLPPGIAEMITAVTGGGGDKASGQDSAGGLPPPTGLNIQLYKLARVDCYMLQAMVPPQDDREESRPSEETSERELGFDDGEGGILAAPKQRDFGGFEGCFDVKIEPEDPKINVNALDFGRGNVDQLIALLSDKRFEFLFEDEDSHGVKMTPADLAINIQDWVDQDKVAAALDPNPSNPLPFQKGFSDENYGYSRYEPRYESKNGRFDSLDELYMVHGVNDQIMAAMRDRLTVYTNPNRVANINTDDPILLWRAILAVGDPRDPKLRDPLFVAQLIQAVRMQRMFSFLGSSTQDFIAVLQSKGVALRPGVGTNGGRGAIEDKTTTFTIRATGEAGAIKKKITTVVRMDQGGLGRLVYWREE